MTHYNTFMQNRLQAFAYPATELDLYECSGFSQGDGVAWYGILDSAALRALAQRQVSGCDGHAPQQSAYQRLRSRLESKRLFELFDLYDGLGQELSLEIYRKGDGRYHHWNAMGVAYPENALDMEQLKELVEEDSSEPDLHLKRWTVYERAWDHFFAWLEEDLKRTSRAIDGELQNIKLAEYVEEAEVWSFETARYRFELHEFNDDDLVGIGPCEWDEEAMMDFLSTLAADEGRVTNLKAVILDRETGDELASDCIWYWFVPKNEKGMGFNQGRRSVFAEAIDEVRRQMSAAEAGSYAEAA
ncbi:hypothetical protein [Halomonas sp. LBP4]|uniref:hypothetical protein n=1 Tax=Halomonas sp. LBP4 TaxID=2044917 RepID=UPI000D7637DA|nr:hypothetical protein [Halomonas sp. LBP4]PXX95885.1 hypothetical protein CR157_16935 [Halomonas sp. LBP4]